MQIDIVKLAEIIGACSVILGVIIGGYKLYDKLIDRLAELEKKLWSGSLKLLSGRAVR